MTAYLDQLKSFRDDYVQPKPGRTLIVGSHVYDDKEDRRLAYKEAVGVDLIDGPGVDVVADLEEAEQAAKLGQFTHIECCSVLEHSRRPWLMAENLTDLLVQGGTIHITVPFVWRIHLYPDDYFRFSPSGVRAIFPRLNWTVQMLSNTRLQKSGKIPAFNTLGHPYLARTETLSFGVKE